MILHRLWPRNNKDNGSDFSEWEKKTLKINIYATDAESII